MNKVFWVILSIMLALFFSANISAASGEEDVVELEYMDELGTLKKRLRMCGMPLHLIKILPPHALEHALMKEECIKEIVKL
jgi:hypothetical protein